MAEYRTAGHPLELPDGPRIDQVHIVKEHNVAKRETKKNTLEFSHQSQRRHSEGQSFKERLSTSDEYGTSSGPLKKRNTETFEPSHKPADMRILVEVASGKSHCELGIQSRDVVYIPDLFQSIFSSGMNVYETLLSEIRSCGIPEEQLFKLWHGDTHMIADDKLRGTENGVRFDYKSRCPTFNLIIQRIRDYFGMNIQATRFNLYRDDTDWKPFHFDAAAVDPEKAKVQNFTVAVSFGETRETAFEDAENHPRNRRVISMPQPDGATYCFSKDINIHWRHGILQRPEEERTGKGRISIIAWGSVEQRMV